MNRMMRTAAVVHYPCSDDRPMAESEAQLSAMLYLLPALRRHFRDRADVYVGGDMFVYYEEGNPGAVVAPDVFVVMGAAKRAEDPRRSYKLWEEPKGPDFVLEVMSRSTWSVDRDEKPELYASLGVQEYWLLDPTGEQYAPRLRGMRLVAGGYRDIPPRGPEIGGRVLRSEVLGLDARVDRGEALRLRDPATGRDLLTYDEEHDGRRVAEVRAQQEAAARETAEAKVAELQALLRESRDGRTAPRDGKQ